jgi:hypothetical protein
MGNAVSRKRKTVDERVKVVIHMHADHVLPTVDERVRQHEVYVLSTVSRHVVAHATCHSESFCGFICEAVHVSLLCSERTDRTPLLANNVLDTRGVGC